jgi:hypothetical protein
MLTLDTVTKTMMSTEQMKGLSVLEHGVLVNNKFKELYNYLYKGKSLTTEWCLPEWLIENKLLIKGKLLSLNIINEYQIYHDCGKPYCLEIDDEGRRRFPNHANKSYEIWTEIGGNKQVGQLIKMDMDIHLLKDVGVEEFTSRPEAITLLLTGLCEVHANADMFGGIDSTSFKIKNKQIKKRGKAILTKIKN